MSVVSTVLDTILSQLYQVTSLTNKHYASKNDPTLDTVDQTLDDSLDSLVKYTRMEPFALIDSELMHIEILKDIQHMTLNILVAYYMQAISILNIGKGIQPTKLLSKINPKVTENIANDDCNDYVDHRFGLPTTEARTTRGASRGRINNNNTKNSGKYGSRYKMDSPSIVKVERGDIAIGHLLTFPFDTGYTTTDITINVTLDTIFCPPELMVDYISANNYNKDFYDRLRQLRAGRIAFWRDFVFATDLAKEHKKLLRMDPNNVLSEIIKRRSQGYRKAITGKGRSYGISNNAVIIDRRTMDKAEISLAGSIDDTFIRNKVFDDLSLLLLVVVDQEYEQITIYFRNKKHSHNITYNMLAKSKLDKLGTAVNDIAKAIASPSTPVF